MYVCMCVCVCMYIRMYMHMHVHGEQFRLGLMEFCSVCICCINHSCPFPATTDRLLP